MCVCASIMPGMPVYRRRSITRAPRGTALAPVPTLTMVSAFVTTTASRSTRPGAVDEAAEANGGEGRQRLGGQRHRSGEAGNNEQCSHAVDATPFRTQPRGRSFRDASHPLTRGEPAPPQGRRRKPACRAADATSHPTHLCPRRRSPAHQRAQHDRLRVRVIPGDRQRDTLAFTCRTTVVEQMLRRDRVERFSPPSDDLVRCTVLMSA